MNFQIIPGDALQNLATLPSDSVDCCVTSPPYWGLRDYGHEGQLGLEPTPEAYVAAMVEVFREVRRVLKPTGTLWLNLGDSYCSTAPGTMGDKLNQRGILTGVSDRRAEAARKPRPVTPHGLKPKDLAGIPWRVAFALQADGWYLRQDIIWHKPNPMPESVTDRCTKAHEYLFLLAKSDRYFYDHEAVKEPGVVPAGTKGAKGSAERFAQPGVNSRPPEYKVYDGMRNKRDVWTIPTKPFKGAHFAVMPEALVEPCILAGCPVGGLVLDPFTGSGTVGAVAARLGRSFVGCELNPDYTNMAMNRISKAAFEWMMS